MAKSIMSASVKDKTLEKARVIAERDRRSFSTIVEIALEEMIERYEKLYGPILVPEASPEVEQVSQC